jgi:hypothetical protein
LKKYLSNPKWQLTFVTIPMLFLGAIFIAFFEEIDEFVDKFDGIFPYFIFLLIIGGFYFLIKKLAKRIKKQLAHHLELLGYAMLFSALILQFVLLDDINNQSENLNNQYMYEKLNIMWEYMHKLQSESPEIAEEYYYEQSKDKDSKIVSGGFYYETNDWQKGLLGEFEKVIKSLYGWIYLLSTIFIAIGRVHEISNKANINRIQDETH